MHNILKLFQLDVYRYDVYKSPNIGLFAKTNDTLIIVPFGYAETKTNKLIEFLKVEGQLNISVAGTRFIGPMRLMNNKGILLPSTASDEEVQALRQLGRLKVERLSSKYTAIGNLISTNDSGALVSPIFEREVDRQIQDVLGVPVKAMKVGGYFQIGSMVVATNTGAAVHPKASEEEIKIISETLRVQVEPVTVNGGTPFLSSGIIANSKSIIVGSSTSGNELIMLSRAFKA